MSALTWDEVTREMCRLAFDDVVHATSGAERVRAAQSFREWIELRDSLRADGRLDEPSPIPLRGSPL